MAEAEMQQAVELQVEEKGDKSTMYALETAKEVDAMSPTPDLDALITRICACGNEERCVNIRKAYPHATRCCFYQTWILIITLIGGLMFSMAEFQHESDLIEKRRDIVDDIYNIIEDCGLSQEELDKLENKMDKLVDLWSVPKRKHQNRWKFFRACFFSITVASTIGYGYQAPRTNLGKVFTFLYGFPAIVLYGFALANIGRLFISLVDRLHAKFKPEPTDAQKKETEIMNHFAEAAIYGLTFGKQRTFGLIVLVITFMLIGALLFWGFENDWTFGDSIYFTWVTVSTIGFGDLEPDLTLEISAVVSSIFVFLALAINSALVMSLQKYVTIKIRHWKLESLAGGAHSKM